MIKRKTKVKPKRSVGQQIETLEAQIGAWRATLRSTESEALAALRDHFDKSIRSLIEYQNETFKELRVQLGRSNNDQANDVKMLHERIALLGLQVQNLHDKVIPPPPPPPLPPAVSCVQCEAFKSLLGPTVQGMQEMEMRLRDLNTKIKTNSMRQ